MIVIVGGAGFVGTRLSQLLVQAGVEHRVLDKRLINDQFIDITDPSTFDSLRGASSIINLAAEHRDDVSPVSLYDEVNVEGSRNLCEFARLNDVRRMVFTSSVAVYGFAPEGADETCDINFFNHYGRTKFLAEEVYKQWYEEEEGRDLVIIRPTVIFGEQNRGNVYNLIKQIAARRFIMFGDGENYKSMAYIQNVAECLRFVTTLKGYHLYNYVDTPDLTINELVSICRKTLFGKEGVGVRLPGWLGKLIGYGFDVLSIITKKKLPISSVRVSKFMGTTAFSTSIANTGFIPSVSVKQGLEYTLRHEFLEEHSKGTLHYSE